ncbi:MAG: hypothetical protein NTZ85_04920 [Bacteroidia bacterium]|nr:hypothetical protein [Bacteroidia bacterium]
MALLHNIRTVAKYEATTLRRSWFFRLFSIGAIFILTLMNIGMFSPVGGEVWGLVSISSSVPYYNLYILNIGQAIVVIFLAADFLKRDKKVDTNEVLYTRSMSNFEYVIGKTWGILRLFLGLDIIILCVGLLMNIISKVMYIDLMSYLAYLLIICVPTILFSLGLAFMLMSLIRNQAITFLLLLGIAALDMFWLWYRLGSIFDYMSFGLPIYKSGVIGFDNLNFIINQRLLYFFLGLVFVLVTVLLFKRLPQSKVHTTLSVILIFISLAGTSICAFNTYSIYKNRIDEKNLVIETNRQFENKNFVSLTDAAIDFSHKGSFFEATADLKFVNKNKESLDRYLFSLNSGLNVNRVISGSKDLTFSKTNHIVEIDPGKSLLPGERDSIKISYSGSINESFCYPNYTDNLKENPYRIQILKINKRQAFLTDNYVLLTPETHWYPVAGLNYYPSNPARIKVDFTAYKLRVKTKNGLTAVSQGITKNENGYFLFSPESPLTGLTIAIGDYKSDTLKVDSIRYINYYFTGHDYYKKDLAEIKDTLKLLVSSKMRDLETNFSTRYPFKTLSFLEVPIQFYSYPRMCTQTRAELQPSMVLLPEKLATLYNANFYKRFARQKKRNARNNQVITDKELQVRLFNDFVNRTFINGENTNYVNGVVWNEPLRYRLGPSFYFFKNSFYSTEYPVINAVFESHLQKLNSSENEMNNYMTGLLSENDRANLILKDASFREMLSKNPGSDTVRAIITIKGDYLFNLMRSKAGIGEFKEWFQKYIDDHKFQSVDITTLNADMKKKFGFEFYPYLYDWFNKKEQPGFLFTDLLAQEIVAGDRTRYMVTFTASNPEKVAGIFNISFRTGGSGSGGQGGLVGVPAGGNYSISMQGRGMEASDISKIIVLDPGQAKKIRTILDAQPRELLVNTLFAKNIPCEIKFPIDEIKKLRNKTTEFKEEEITVSIPLITLPGEIIVDNEDPGFDAGKLESVSPLKKILGISNKRNNNYGEIYFYWAPERWTPVVQSTYYGKYVLSSVYARSGKGDRSVTWTTKLTDPGLYDIYCYIGKAGDATKAQSGSGQQPPGEQRSDNNYKDMHYKIYYDEGVEEITVDFGNAEPGWNNLGRYYISHDSAKVEMTNKSAGRIVLADAIKWVKAD